MLKTVSKTKTNPSIGKAIVATFESSTVISKLAELSKIPIPTEIPSIEDSYSVLAAKRKIKDLEDEYDQLRSRPFTYSIPDKYKRPGYSYRYDG